jgi:hypothetical protein
MQWTQAFGLVCEVALRVGQGQGRLRGRQGQGLRGRGGAGWQPSLPGPILNQKKDGQIFFLTSKAEESITYTGIMSRPRPG